MMPLSVWIRRVGQTNSRHLVQQSAVRQRRLPQIDPVAQAATRDDIVDGGKGESLVIKVSMKHVDR